MDIDVDFNNFDYPIPDLLLNEGGLYGDSYPMCQIKVSNYSKILMIVINKIVQLMVTITFGTRFKVPAESNKFAHESSMLDDFEIPDFRESQC